MNECGWTVWMDKGGRGQIGWDILPEEPVVLGFGG